MAFFPLKLSYSKVRAIFTYHGRGGHFLLMPILYPAWNVSYILSVTCLPTRKALCLIINPRCACARGTVLGLSVVFSLSWHLAQSGVQTAVSATSARYGHEIQKGIFLKTLHSEVMVSFAYSDSPLRHSLALELAFSTTEYSKVV